MKVLSPKVGLLSLLALFCLGNIANGQSVFTVHKNGKFYHILSTLPGAYDLMADTTRTASEADSLKDFVDTDVAGDFGGKWKAGNATTFVNAPGYPTFNAQTGSPDFTVAKIDSLFKAGTPVTFQNNPGTGSKHVWIAKIRGGTSYVVVKFLTRIGNNNDCNCPNQGVTEFEYWKMPSGSTGIRPDMIVDRPAIHFKRSSGKNRMAWNIEKANGPLVLDMLGRIVQEETIQKQKSIGQSGN